MQVDWNIGTVARGARAGDTDNTLPKPLLLDTKQSTGRKTVFSPALSADQPEEACRPVVQVVLREDGN